MKSVFKNVAPIAMTITFALSGVAMADTATTAAKSADNAAVSQSAKTTATETTKPAVHNHHKSKQQKLEQAEAKTSATPVTIDKSVATKPTATDKVASVESSKNVEAAKAK